jgi:hypothetical protein
MWLCSGTCTLEDESFHPLASVLIWQSDCEYRFSIFNSSPRRYAMLGELTTIPTHTLIDMLSVILAGGEILTLSDVAELEQIQRELQSRDYMDHLTPGRPN